MDVIAATNHTSLRAGPKPLQCQRWGQIWACARRTGEDSAEVLVAAPTVERGVYLYAAAHAPPRWLDRAAEVVRAVYASNPAPAVVDLGGFGWPVEASRMAEAFPEVGWVDDVLSVAGGIVGGYFGGPAGAAGGAAAGRLAGAGIESAIAETPAGVRYQFIRLPDPLPAGAVRYRNVPADEKRGLWDLATEMARGQLRSERRIDYSQIMEPRDLLAMQLREPSEGDVASRRTNILRTYARVPFSGMLPSQRVAGDAGAGAATLLQLVGALLAAQQGNTAGAFSQGAGALGGLANRAGATGVGGALNTASAATRPTRQTGTPNAAGGASTAPATALQQLLGQNATTPGTQAALLATLQRLLGGATGASQGASSGTSAGATTDAQVRALLGALGAAR